MDLASGLKEDFKKLFLNYIALGALILAPPAYYFFQQFKPVEIEEQRLALIKDFSSGIIVGIFILCLVLGHLVLKMGHRFEIIIDNYIFSGRYEEFDKLWYEYLKTTFEKNKEPTLVRYYSDFLIGLRFELGLLVALPITYTELFYLDQIKDAKILEANTHIGLLILLFFVYIWLYNEARQGISEAHILRTHLVEIFKSKNKLP
jgi:hypothetical protein